MYCKRFFVYDGNSCHSAVIRNYREEDFEGLIRVQKECFPPPFPPELWWNKQQLINHVMRFPAAGLGSIA